MSKYYSGLQLHKRYNAFRLHLLLLITNAQSVFSKVQHFSTSLLHLCIFYVSLQPAAGAIVARAYMDSLCI